MGSKKKKQPAAPLPQAAVKSMGSDTAQAELEERRRLLGRRGASFAAGGAPGGNPGMASTMGTRSLLGMAMR